MREIPEDVIKKIKEERESECDEGDKAAIQYATESGFWLIERTVNELNNDAIRADEVSSALRNINYFIQSSVWKDCFLHTLIEILDKSEEK